MQFATVGTEHRLEWSGRQEAWRPEGDLVVVEVDPRGWVEITSPKIWGERQGISPEAAMARVELLASGSGAGERVYPPYLARLVRRPGRGRPSFRIKLPAAAIMALFDEEGANPLGSKFERKSAQVLLRVLESSLFVFSQRGFRNMFSRELPEEDEIGGRDGGPDQSEA